MINALILVWIGTLCYELSNVKMKKLKDELWDYQKALILWIFWLIVLLATLAITWNWQYEISFLSIGLTILYVISLLLFFKFFLLAVKIADRSTMSTFWVLLLPLLLLFDLILWYSIATIEILGVIFVTLTLLITSYKGSMSLNWISYVLLSLFFSAIMISIINYALAYNSLEAQMIMTQSLTSIALFFIVFFQSWVKWLSQCLNVKYYSFGLLNAWNVLLNNMALVFGPASVITTFRKVWEVLWGVVFWKIVFKETNFIRKISTAIVLVFWVFTMNYQAFAKPESIEFLTNIDTWLFMGDISWTYEYIKEISLDDFSEKLKDTKMHYLY